MDHASTHHGRRRAGAASAALTLLLACTGSVAGEPAGAPALPEPAALNCLTCHRGGPTNERAALGDLDTTTIARRLLAFRSGERPATIMDRITRAYTPAQLRAIAAALPALLR